MSMDEKNEKEEKSMKVVAKNEYRKLSLSSRKIKEISVRPIVKEGRALFEKNHPSHRYIMDEEDR